MLGSHASKDEIAYLKAKDVKEIAVSSRTSVEALNRVLRLNGICRASASKQEARERLKQVEPQMLELLESFAEYIRLPE